VLIGLDETLHHQASRPFRMAGVSDHRFFDRYWFSAVHPTGDVAAIAGLAFYKNMGTCDGFMSIQHGGIQHNLRLSRPLAGQLETTTVGPLQVAVVEPFRHLHITLEPNEHDMAADLHWQSDFHPHVEAHHLQVFHDRVTQDSTRYDQIGRWSGWVDLAGERFPVEDWWGVRDHSWGVRPGVGGFEPALSATSTSMLWLWSCFSTEEYSCQFQLREDGDGNRLYFDGHLDYRVGDDREPVRTVDVQHDVSFVPGTRAFDDVHYELQLEDGRTLKIEAQPVVQPWAYSGTGYSGGYLDGKGLGTYRGEVVEHDVYDITDTELVLLNGEPHHAGHREQPVSVTVDGKSGYFGHMPVITTGSVRRYGLV
jgi:hypothetical protein